VRDVEAARDFLRAGIAEGGVQIEPNVDIEKEYALHAMLAPDGSTERGRLLEQRSDAHGAWIESRPIDAPDLERRLVEEIDRVATALHAAGYFGPFGVDAFAYAGGFQPRSEINARYSMAFALGFQGKSWPASPSSSLSASSR
jgi:hypothetical protein